MISIPHIGRVIQTGDLHLARDLYEDQRPVCRWLVDQAQDGDVVILCGDLYGHARPHLSTPGERTFLLEELILPLRRYGCRVVVVRGNHDHAEDWAWLDHLPGVHYFDRPGQIGNGVTLINVLPYPDRSWLAAQGGSRDEVTEATYNALRGVLVGFGIQRARMGQDRAMLTGHLNVRGALTSTGQPMIGTEVEVPVPWFSEAGIDLALLNHIHLPQEHQGALCEVVHVGSPWPTTYGETEDKSIVIATPTAEGWSWERRQTPHVKRITVRLSWDEAASDWIDEAGTSGWVVVDGMDIAGARVRLTVSYRKGAGSGVDGLVRVIRDAGAIDVKLVREVTSDRVERAPEVVKATGLIAQYQAFERDAGREPSEGELALLQELAEAV